MAKYSSSQKFFRKKYKAFKYNWIFPATYATVWLTVAKTGTRIKAERIFSKVEKVKGIIETIAEKQQP